MAPTSQSTPPLLALPPELRREILTHLLPRKPTAHPLPGAALTQVSHPPPAAALLNIHPLLTDETLEVFYSVATWTLVLEGGVNFFRIDPGFRVLERSHLLRRICRVECVVFCDLRQGMTQWTTTAARPTTRTTIGGGTAAESSIGGSGSPGSNSSESTTAKSPIARREAQGSAPTSLDLKFNLSFTNLRHRIRRAAEVLFLATNLRSVTVSWMESGNGTGSMTSRGGVSSSGGSDVELERERETHTDLAAKAALLHPLRTMKGKTVPVTFHVGRMHGVKDADGFAKCVLGVLGEEPARWREGGSGEERAPH